LTYNTVHLFYKYNNQILKDNEGKLN